MATLKPQEHPSLSDRLAVRPDEACKLVSMSRARFYQLLQSGEIPSFTVGRMRLINVEALRQWMDGRSPPSDATSTGRRRPPVEGLSQ